MEIKQEYYFYNNYHISSNMSNIRPNLMYQSLYNELQVATTSWPKFKIFYCKTLKY